MRKGSLLVAGLLAAAAMATLVAPSCTQERRDTPTASGGLDPGVTPGTTGSGNGGDGNGDGDGAGGGDAVGSGGRGGGGGDGGGEGVGGGPVSLPECACLLDVPRTTACGTCVQFGVVDQCNTAYSACRNDADCVSVDLCILDQRCANSACIEECRSLGTPEALDLLDAMYACACAVCSGDCDTGDSCR